MQTFYYILFDSHEQAIRLRKELTNAGCRTRISPTPRKASLCCGVSLMITLEEMPKIQDYLDSHPESVYKSICKIDQDFNAKRDSYI